MSSCAIELYWIPVAAGTSRFQRASLRCWEAFEAARARRARAILYHSALKLRCSSGETSTLELTPAFLKSTVPAIATGPVGIHAAGRLRLFRYQLLCLPTERLPDEEWAGSPVQLAGDCATVDRVFELMPQIPRHVWGRRVRGTREMWTSDSVVSWLLIEAGIDLSSIAPPAGGRAPGWDAGIALASAP